MAYLGTYPIGVDQNKYLEDDVLSQIEQAENQTGKLSMDAWAKWNYQQGSKIRVVCYTNAAKAQLVLNGKKIGKAKPYNTNTGIIHWDIPFEAGKLEVVGLDKNNKETARYAINTPQQAYAIKITEADSKIEKNGGVAQIRLQIVDKNGVRVAHANNEILCNVTGPGELLGLEAGNNVDMGDYTDNKQKAYKGMLTAYIRATGSLGDIKVELTAKGIKGEKVNVVVY
ncbi:DUF4982 domain-containing protein [Pedobacter sp. BS3]|uniref:DUF4982 domain-containing protein n=1 Tax=Pedobacter sp. BS3 TaxID=2567937 RepID=UPI0011EEF63D|nr:DUF4982 domain-containing protein [Pedobacter sp. BS3]TZF81524.1 DUF4982 domain-containing protein [Pedobacter sp. BS3]